MGIITAIEEIKKQGKRVGIYVDGKFTLSVSLETAVQEKLRVDTELDQEGIEALMGKDDIFRCREAALRFIGYRPRSENELRERLRKRGFKNSTINVVVAKLRDTGLVDDISFAGFWKDNRESFSPRSRYLTRLELRKKGIAEEVIDRTVDSIDDSENAYRLASDRAGRLQIADYDDFRKRLGDYLRRRGFDFEVINHAVERVWQEKQL